MFEEAHSDEGEEEEVICTQSDGYLYKPAQEERTPLHRKVIKSRSLPPWLVVAETVSFAAVHNQFSPEAK